MGKGVDIFTLSCPFLCADNDDDRSVFIWLCFQTAGDVLLIVRLIIRSITVECVVGPCYD